MISSNNLSLKHAVSYLSLLHFKHKKFKINMSNNQQTQSEMDKYPDEYCPKYKEVYVAQDTKTGEFLGNTSIFYKGNANLVFLPQLGKEIQKEYNLYHSVLVDKYKQLDRVTPYNIDQTTRDQWKSMNEGVKQKIMGMEQQIMELMRKHPKLVELEKLLNEVQD